jgi:hypothetical protein
MLHHTVNHYETFRDIITGVHTNSIEGTWNGLKIYINFRNHVLDKIQNHIDEFQFRK